MLKTGELKLFIDRIVSTLMLIKPLKNIIPCKNVWVSLGFNHREERDKAGACVNNSKC